MSILNIIEWSKGGFSLKSSFAVLIPLHFCRASLQGARHSLYSFSLVYMHVLCVACAWLVRACIVRLSGFFRAITCTFMHGFQNNSAQLFTLTRRSAIWNICSGTLKVKVILEGQMIKWSYIDLAHTITCTFMHGFLNNLARLFFLKSRSASAFAEVGWRSRLHLKVKWWNDQKLSLYRP